MKNRRGTESLPKAGAAEVPVSDALASDIAGPVATGGWFLAEDLNGDPIVVRLCPRLETGC